MTVDEPMTIHERRKYLGQMQKSYRTARQSERTALLDEMETVTGLHRKSLVRLMGSDLERQSRQRQRGRSYGPDVLAARTVIAESLDWICAERLQPQLVEMAEHLARRHELSLSPKTLAQLGQISVSTVRRWLASRPRERPRLPRRGPEAANHLRRSIPVERIAWQESQPGHLEVDLVHHSGDSTAGQYVHTLPLVDVATGWSERVAILGRSFLVMQDAFQRVLARLPFPILERHSDNGSEFLNDYLIRFWRTTVSGVHLSRSRAWQKNDNRFVEQKNSTLVRAYLGHRRLDTVAQTNALNRLYAQMGLYDNRFQPVLRLQAKDHCPGLPGQPPHRRRRFSPAQTPFDRLAASDALLPDQRTRLDSLRQTTNPRQLRDACIVSWTSSSPCRRRRRTVARMSTRPYLPHPQTRKETTVGSHFQMSEPFPSGNIIV